MPVSGGYKVRVSALETTQVGTISAASKREDNDWLTWLSIGLTVVEVGAMLIPGVGPLVSTGIAAAGVAAQTGIEYAQTGTVSDLSIGLNAASLVLPGLTALGSNARNTIKISKGIREAIEAQEALGFTARQSTKFQEVFKDTSKWYRTAEKNLSNTTKETLEFFDKTFKGTAKLNEISNKLNKAFVNELLKDISNGVKSRAVTEAIDNITREAEKDLSLTANIEREFIDKFGVLEAQELFRQVARAETRAERRAIINSFLAERLTTEEAWIFSEGLKMIGSKQFKEAAEEISYASQRAAKRAMKKAIREANKDAFWDATVSQRMNKVVRGIGSSNFNNRVVQVIQLMDPADAGRFFVERLYRRMVKYFKPLFRILGNVNKIEDAFVKAGGTLVNSHVIVGYRVIGYNKKNPAYSDIMISFYPEMTKSKNAFNKNGKPNKNYHGKPPVFVTASPVEIDGLIKGGMKYYQRKWAISKGGRPMSFGGLEGMGTALMLILPFMNTGLLRNILSLGSNVSKMAKRFKERGGEGWIDDFAKSFRRAVVNRPGRFIARAVLAPLGGRFGRLTGLIISRESQRFIGIATTAANVALEGRKPKDFYQSMRSQLKAMTNSYGNRAIRSQGNWNAKTQQKKYKRKLTMIRRLPGAFGL